MSKFKSMVRGMEKDVLEELRRTVAQELEGRRQKTAIQIEDIHPMMTAAEKEAAIEEIARALRGEDA
jgi:hypothetical protein